MTPPSPRPSPGSRSSGLSRQQVIDQYFMEHRAKVLDIAAFLDRVERAGTGGSGEDVRTAVMRRAIGILIDGKPERARRVLEVMSDPTIEPIPQAGTKGAIGVWPESGAEARREGGRA